MRSVILTSAYLGPVSYYAQMFRADTVWMEQFDHYEKQTYRNRCRVAGPQGVQDLTIPIVRTGGKCPTGEVMLSPHGNWQHVHWNALVAAYENSPYFEYYADEFRPFYNEFRPMRLVDFNAGLNHVVCDLLQIEPHICPTSHYLTDTAPDVRDLRTAISPKKPALVPTPPYYQVFSRQNGFLPELSIADLLFNLGPEARIVLHQMARESL